MLVFQTHRVGVPAAPGISPFGLLWRLVQSVERANQRSRQRRALARLDARLLRDIGVSPEQARRETTKPFWRD